VAKAVCAGLALALTVCALGAIAETVAANREIGRHMGESTRGASGDIYFEDSYFVVVRVRPLAFVTVATVAFVGGFYWQLKRMRRNV